MPIIEGVEVKTRNDYLLQNGYLLFENLLCIMNTSLWFAIVQEIHKQDHFGAEKTLHLIREKFFWPGMSKDIKLFVKRCQIYQNAKGTDTNQGLYIPLSISTAPWQDISIDFVVGLPITRKKMIASLWWWTDLAR
jgi:Integrase zinc binding domain